MKYTVVKSNMLADLEGQVNVKLGKGYVCVGGLSTSVSLEREICQGTFDYYTNYSFAQAMIREDETNAN